MEKKKKVRVPNPMQFYNAVEKLVKEAGLSETSSYSASISTNSRYYGVPSVWYVAWVGIDNYSGETMQDCLKELATGLEAKKAAILADPKKENESSNDELAF